MTENVAIIQKLIADGAKKDETIKKLEAEIEKYKEILLNKEKPSEDMFLIYKNDFGEDSIDIIGRNIREFGELLYYQGHKLIARRLFTYSYLFYDFIVIVSEESDREFCIYLASFDGNSNFHKSIKMIENLTEKKRKEEKEEKEEKLQYFQQQSIKREEKLYALEVSRFYAQRNLNYVRNSSEIMEKMCLRLSTKNDLDTAEPPFKDIISMEEKKKELIAYFDLLQKNLDGPTEETEMQINIRDWMSINWPQLVYEPTTSEKEEWKKEMEQKLNVQNTIGTVCFIPFTGGSYFFFCIANSKIITWNCGLYKEDALKNVYGSLRCNLNQTWDTNAKFATDLEVTDDYSDYFVHVSTDKIMKISNNQKVMKWVTNNFEFLKYTNKECYHHSIPAIYYLALKGFEESIS